MHFSRRIVGWPLVVALILGAVVLFGSQLFRTLGFEYSTISALILSLACGFTACSVANRGLDLRETVKAATSRSALLMVVPLVVSLLSLPFLPNCAFGDGLGFYLAIALPKAVLSIAFGLAIGKSIKSRRWAFLAFGGFWLATLLISLLPGYIFPQLFTYGWQYGYFPGLVWDENIELGAAYGWHLMEWGLLAVILLATAYGYARGLTVMVLIVPYVLLFALRSENGVVTSHSRVKEHLSSSIKIDRFTTIHYNARSLSREEAELLRLNTLWYLHDIREKLSLNDSTREINIFLYPSTESLYHLIGTRNASIAKPWMSELHIAKENLESLKHELVHVLVREWASFPFYASWSTALTEGVAMALEPSYDGIRNVHEHASAILTMKLGDGVHNIMGFAGFASGASTTSYVLSGSFTTWLLDMYGASKMREVYRSLDFEEVYGKRLTELEREWKRYLESKDRLTQEDSLRTKFYFDRRSMLSTPCLRRIGKLQALARQAMEEGRYSDAEAQYRELYRESGSINALRGNVLSFLRRGKFGSARGILDTARISAHPQAPSLLLYKGDAVLPLYYDSLIDLELSSGSTLTAWARKYVEDRSQYLRAFYTSRSSLGFIPFTFLDTVGGDIAMQRIANFWLTAEAYHEDGMLSHARHYYVRAIREAQAAGVRSRILTLMALRVLSIDPFYREITLERDLSSGEMTRGLLWEIDEADRRAAYLEQFRSGNSDATVQ
jgi:tetratricopeptide (TPR) repeat protein